MLTFNFKQKYSTRKKTPHYIWGCVKNNGYVVSFLKKHNCGYVQNFVCARSHTAKVRVICISKLSPFQLQQNTISETLKKLKLHERAWIRVKNCCLSNKNMFRSTIQKWKQQKKNSTQKNRRVVTEIVYNIMHKHFLKNN